MRSLFCSSKHEVFLCSIINGARTASPIHTEQSTEQAPSIERQSTTRAPTEQQLVEALTNNWSGVWSKTLYDPIKLPTTLTRWEEMSKIVDGGAAQFLQAIARSLLCVAIVRCHPKEYVAALTAKNQPTIEPKTGELPETFAKRHLTHYTTADIAQEADVEAHDVAERPSEEHDEVESMRTSVNDAPQPEQQQEGQTSTPPASMEVTPSNETAAAATAMVPEESRVEAAAENHEPVEAAQSEAVPTESVQVGALCSNLLTINIIIIYSLRRRPPTQRRIQRRKQQQLRRRQRRRAVLQQRKSCKYTVRPVSNIVMNSAVCSVFFYCFYAIYYRPGGAIWYRSRVYGGATA